MNGTDLDVALDEDDVRVAELVVEWDKTWAQGLHRRYLIRRPVDPQEPAAIAIRAKEPDSVLENRATDSKLRLGDPGARCRSAGHVVSDPAGWGSRERAAAVKRIGAGLGNDIGGKPHPEWGRSVQTAGLQLHVSNRVGGQRRISQPRIDCRGHVGAVHQR